jgi:quinol monooxygenase YgiN
MILIVVKFAVRPDRADEWIARTAEFTAATRTEPGNLWFDWSRSVDDPNEYVLVEAFRDAEAGAAHVGTAHFATAMRELGAFLTAVPKIVNVEVPGTDWSELGEMAVPD